MRQIALASDSNVGVFPAHDGSTLITNLTEDNYVILREPSKAELTALLTEFRQRQLAEIKALLYRFPGERQDGVDLPVALANSPYGQTLQLFYLRPSAVRRAIRDLGLDLKYPSEPGEHALRRLRRIQRTDALAILDRVLGTTASDFLAAVTPTEWKLFIDLELEHDLSTARDSRAFLHKLAQSCNDLFVGRRTAREGNRPSGRYMFAKALHCAGILLFPRNIWARLYKVLPSPFADLYPSLLLASDAMPFYNRCIEWLAQNSDGNEGTRQAYLKALRFLDHTSTFAASLGVSSRFIQVYKLWERDRGGNFSAATGFRYIWRFQHEYHGLSISDDIDSLKVAGKIKKRYLAPWPWVDDPKVHTRDGHYERIVGRPEQVVQPPHIVGWAVAMRKLLTLRRLKQPRAAEKVLNEWLLFLCTHPDPPVDFDSISRQRHINSGGNPQHYTFMDYLEKRAIPVASKNRALTELRHLWLLDATTRGEDLSRCPVDPKIDRVKERSTRRGRTHRNAIDQEILEILIEENRRDDFAFSRSRVGLERAQGDYRRVRDPDTGTTRKEWWPGPAVLVDMLFNIPLRKFSARYLDSGEGDELVLDIETLQHHPNPLPSATKGRHEGFFVRKPDGVKMDRWLLGMYINTNKTGAPYEVAWIEPGVAQNVRRLIDWQKRFNPLKKPVLCRDDASSDAYTDTSLYADSYPIFRDPDSPLGYPISENKLSEYFYALLRHCEPIISRRLGIPISLFRPDGTPFFDLHSLRVTGVTILIENGVDPEIVKVLVGHASLEITMYYFALRDATVHAAIQAALERRRLKRSHLERMGSAELSRLGMHFINLRSPSDAIGVDLLTTKILEKDRAWEMLSHGICPGASCAEGGKFYRNAFHSLPRERACSLCRFRITGPMFLAGLVQNANRIMWEIKDSLRKVRRMLDSMAAAEDEGQDPEAWRGEARREQNRCDELWEEWFAELRYVKRCEAMLHNWLAQTPENGAEDKLPIMMTNMNPGDFEVRIQEVHDLRFVHNLIKGSRVIAGVDLPRGVIEDRNKMLLQIARENGIGRFELSLDPELALRSLDLFAEVILSSTVIDQLPRDGGQDPIEELLNGSIKLAHVPGAEETLLNLFGANSSSAYDIAISDGNVTLVPSPRDT